MRVAMEWKIGQVAQPNPASVRMNQPRHRIAAKDLRDFKVEEMGP
ncbi:MAG TPA: hypothetical protein VE714_01560 [Gemmatimonadales bacterium]|nr:hypothetical protein [Gemmatimonadales bacterium]